MNTLASDYLRLVLVTDGSGKPAQTLRVLKGAYDGGIRAFQFRERKLEDAEYLRLLRRARKLFPKGKALIFVNDRVDLCLASDADGVQLGYRSFPLPEARKLLGKRFLIGVSTHSEKDLVQAKLEGADFAAFGPIFPTPSKRGILRPAGLSRLKRIVKHFDFPVLAIGGIRSSNLGQVLQTGCAGAALIREVFRAKSPVQKAKELTARFGSSKTRQRKYGTAK